VIRRRLGENDSPGGSQAREDCPGHCRVTLLSPASTSVVLCEMTVPADLKSNHSSIDQNQVTEGVNVKMPEE
jgi:hypothetical protein